MEKLEEKINAACLRSGRRREDIELMGVTKFQSPETVVEALGAGLRLFGESRVQEALKKFSPGSVPHFCDLQKRGEAKLHFIGNLQRNKAGKAADFFDCIQSVDRDSLIDELGALTSTRENPLMILLEYHTGEESKAGFRSRDALFRAAERVISFPGLLPAGLMTMAPFKAGKAAVRSAFRELSLAREELLKRFRTFSWDCLSMGMTEDFELAIEEGSTLIRIGSALFGEQD